MRFSTSIRRSRSLLLVAVQVSAYSRSAAAAAASFTSNRSLSKDIISKYDGFILDQFGVLHDGTQAMEGAVACVEELYKRGKSLIVLSNTSAPSHAALKRLPRFGFDPNYFVGAVTSGEEASKYVQRTFGASDKASRAVFVTWDATDRNNPRLTALPEVFLEQCGNVEVASTVEEADFLLLHGSEVWYRGDAAAAQSISPFIEEGTLGNVDPLLEQCIARDLPAVLCNPDNIVRTPTGGTAHMPGKLAARYEEMGGSCIRFGKPEVEHFEACIEQLGLEKSRVAHVGDSLHHDISGALASGIPNIFVTSGIHANELGVEFGELPEKKTLESLFSKEGSTPTHVVSAFRV